MNKYVTYCAQAKLRHLMEKDGACSIRITTRPQGSVAIEMVHVKTAWTSDILLTETPRIYTNLFTLKQLTDASVDFDYPSEEFVITRTPRDILAHA